MRKTWDDMFPELATMEPGDCENCAIMPAEKGSPFCHHCIMKDIRDRIAQSLARGES